MNNNDWRREEKCGREEGDLEIWGLRGRSGDLEFCMNGCAGNAA